MLEQLRGKREHLRPIVELALQTGRRRGALPGLRWNLVNLGAEPIFVEVKGRLREIGPNRLLVERNKLGEPYIVPLNRVARKLLARLSEDATKSEYVFRYSVARLNLTEIKRAFKSACEDAKINGLTFHDLRHTWSTRAADLGVPEPVRRDILGHCSRTMTDSYTHSTREARERAVELVSEYGEERTGEDCVKNAERPTLWLASRTA